MKNVMFMYWGRRGAASKLALEIASCSADIASLNATFSISRQNELFHLFDKLGSALFPVNTFQHSAGALTNAWRIPQINCALAERLGRDDVQLCVDLMPHVWSPFVVTAIKDTGALYAPIIHDADAHIGDHTGAANSFALRAIRHADFVICLSATVRNRLLESGRVPPGKIVTLFHPNFDYGGTRIRQRPQLGAPRRLLFFGRIMAYKGLDLFVETAEILRAMNCNIEVGVFGEGPLGALSSRLQALGAEVVNHWLDEREICEALDRYDIMVLSHTSASQSGVVAAAHGAAMPVVATPVGGLMDQIIDGETGLIAKSVSAHALADAVANLVSNDNLYDKICNTIIANSSDRHMPAFLNALMQAARERSN